MALSVCFQIIETVMYERAVFMYELNRRGDEKGEMMPDVVTSTGKGRGFQPFP